MAEWRNGSSARRAGGLYLHDRRGSRNSAEGGAATFAAALKSGRFAPVLQARNLFDPQLPLNLLQRHTLRLWNHSLHPNELQHHHACKERENVSRRKGGDHLGEESGEQGGEDPVCEAAQSLAFRAMTIGKYLGDKYPDDRALADRVRSDEGENANRYERQMISKKRPRNEAERRDVAVRANK